MMTRRFFLGALAVVSAAGGSSVATMLARRSRLQPGIITGASVRDLGGKRVVLRGDNGCVVRGTVHDVTVQSTRSGLSVPGTEQMSLLVRTTDPGVEPGTYRLEEEDLVLEDLYFSPVGLVQKERHLEAVITRLT